MLTKLYYDSLAAAPFEPGSPQAPSEGIKATTGAIWGNVGWIVAAVACFALAGCVFLAFKNERSGGSNEAVGHAAKIIGAILGFGVIVGFVGTVTGT